MLATKASAKSNIPSTMRHDRIMRIRREDPQSGPRRIRQEGIDNNLAPLKATTKSDAPLFMLNGTHSNKVDKLTKLKKLFTPSASWRPQDLTPRSHPERFQCDAVVEWQSTNQPRNIGG